MYGQGILLKIKKNKAIVFSDNATYITIKRKKGMHVGQRIWLTGKDIQQPNIKTVKYVYWAAAVAAVLALVLLPVKLGMYTQTFAYFSVDVNPSIEMAVDKHSNIIKIYPKNQKGEELAGDLDLKNKNIKDAVLLIVDKTRSLGFYDSQNKTTVLVTAALSGNKAGNEVSRQKLLDMQHSIKEVVEKTYGTSVILKEYLAEPEIKKAADINNLSIGRESILSIITDAGINISAEDAKSMQIADMLKTIEEKERSFVSDSKGKIIAEEINKNTSSDNKSEEKKETSSSAGTVNPKTSSSSAGITKPKTSSLDKETTNLQTGSQTDNAENSKTDSSSIKTTKPETGPSTGNAKNPKTESSTVKTTRSETKSSLQNLIKP